MEEVPGSIPGQAHWGFLFLFKSAHELVETVFLAWQSKTNGRTVLLPSKYILDSRIGFQRCKTVILRGTSRHLYDPWGEWRMASTLLVASLLSFWTYFPSPSWQDIHTKSKDIPMVIVQLTAYILFLTLPFPSTSFEVLWPVAVQTQAPELSSTLIIPSSGSTLTMTNIDRKAIREQLAAHCSLSLRWHLVIRSNVARYNIIGKSFVLHSCSRLHLRLDLDGIGNFTFATGQLHLHCELRPFPHQHTSRRACFDGCQQCAKARTCMRENRYT